MIHQIEPYITEKEIEAVSEYLRNGGWLTEFKKTEEFEHIIADFLGVKYAVAVTSGTVGLYLALLALDMRKKNVIVPNYTMIATPNAMLWAGAYPNLVDIDENTFCLDITKIGAVTKAKAMIYVSINGRCNDLDKVKAYCEEHDMYLIEDACQAFGSKYKDKYLGAFGDIGVFSLTPHKLITTGQGGLVITNNHNLYKKVKKLKDFGRISPGIDIHDQIGYNFKFTDLQAVIGIEQMKNVDFRRKRKKEIYNRYERQLPLRIGTFVNQKGCIPWFVDIVLASKEIRDHLYTWLKDHGIGSRSFYPPINHQKIYSGWEKGKFPISEKLAQRGLWLPSSLKLTDNQIDFVCEKIREFFRN